MNMMKNLSSSSNTITPHIINSIWKLRFLHADHRVGYKGPSRARLLASFGTSLVNKQTNKQQKLKEVLFTSTCSLLMLTLHLLVLHLLCPLFSFLPGQKPDCDDVRWLTVKWYTGMRKLSFLVVFHNFWYINGWVSVPDLIRPICKIGCIWENLAKKHPICPNLGVFCDKLV